MSVILKTRDGQRQRQPITFYKETTVVTNGLKGKQLLLITYYVLGRAHVSYFMYRKCFVLLKAL